MVFDPSPEIWNVFDRPSSMQTITKGGILIGTLEPLVGVSTSGWGSD